MKALILQGSPRKGGNTTIVCDAMAQAMTEAGAEVERLRVADMNISGCTECYACQKQAEAPGCSVDDDMTAVYQKLLAADLVVLATPVFCWGVTAQLKAALDRFYAFCKFSAQEGDRFKCLIEGKSMALVVTAGGGPDDGADVCVSQFRSMVQFLRLENRGELVAAPVGGEPETVAADEALMTRAAEFGRHIVGS